MKFLILLLFTFVSSSCVSHDQITQDKLYGEYSHVSGDAYYEAFFLDTDGGFYSWLHERPASQGEWKLVGNEIHISDSSDNGSIYVLEIIKLNHDEATFHTKDIGESAIYSRTYHYKDIE